jgi:Tol biopolymer transport system component
VPSRTALLPAAVVLALVAGCIVALVMASMKPAEAAFPGRNGAIVFAGGKPGERGRPLVYRVRPDGSGVKRLAEGAFIAGLDYSADGRKLVWSEDTCPDEGYDCNTLFVANANGTGQHPLSATIPGAHTPHNISPSWYPAGRRIVFSANPYGSATDSKAALFVVSLDENGNATSTPTQWTDNAGQAFEWGAEVSPDGSKIAFASDRDGDDEIYVMDANKPEGPGNSPVQLTDNPVRDMAPDWSPDGKRIVYESRRKDGIDWDVVVMNADGTFKKNLTRNPADDRLPAFSPNGKSIAFTRDTSDWRREVWKMRADGTRQVRLTEGFELALYPDWRPRP